MKYTYLSLPCQENQSKYNYKRGIDQTCQAHKWDKYRPDFIPV